MKADQLKLLLFNHNKYSFLIFFIFWPAFLIGISAAENGRVNVHVGVILDLGSVDGVVYNSSISMAVEDFYRTIGREYRTRLVLHYRDSKSSVVEAAAAAYTFGVEAIIGPQTSEEADFVAHMGTEARVPIVSFSAVKSTLIKTSPSRTPYFIRVAQSDSTQARPIAAILKAFNWKDVILVHDDSYRGNGLIPYLTEAFRQVLCGTSVVFRTIALPSSTADEAGIRQIVGDFIGLTARVFIVHLPVSLAGIFFRQVNEAGMMVVLENNILGSFFFSSLSTASMEGVLGIKTYVPKSLLLDNFRLRWKRKFQKQHPEADVSDIGVYALWAYDAAWATAMAAEKAFSAGVSPYIPTSAGTNYSTALMEGSRVRSTKLLQALIATPFHGLTGEINLGAEPQLNSSSTIFEITNVASDDGERKVGYWTSSLGLSRTLTQTTTNNKSHKSTESSEDLAAIIWPGGNTRIPKSPVDPSNVTVFIRFVKVEWDPMLKRNVTKGYAVDIFLTVLDSMPYKVLPDFQPYDNGRVDDLGYYDDLIYQLYEKRYDAVVGDVTITGNRSNYVDFTHPAAVTKKYGWFLAPVSVELWFATAGISVLKGILIWFFEHSTNEEFQGTTADKVGKILYFSFTIFVFANREKLQTNHARFISGLWTFVVFVLVTSYGANLTSILTVEKLRPKVTDLQTLINNKEKIGCQSASSLELRYYLKLMGADESNIKTYASVEEYAEALNLGSANGGVSAIVDEVPYIKIFLKNNCRNYTMAGKTYQTGGFGFAFARGSPMVSDVSRAILRLEQVKTNEIESKWFGNTTCPDPLEATDIGNELSLSSFRFVYLTTLSISAATVILYLINIWYEQRKRAGIAAAEDSKNDAGEDSHDDPAQAVDETDTATHNSDQDAAPVMVGGSRNSDQAGPSSPAGSESRFAASKYRSSEITSQK
ncbi:hypothetical protein H6P81_000500 [Aristolochia fimbriata]|uniref:Glutamate receptor n=1 Tax=Aristolochia fimbriata TaxID=158543 RepID=A0AAV7F4F3_ARIFI|nr:hypothetical protein H6P81_000500 [Aristolochia fimbriata]